MPEHKLDNLLEAIPRIAEVVNKFKSEEVQKLAFQHFMDSLGFEEQSADNQKGASRAKRRASIRKRKTPKELSPDDGNTGQARKGRKRTSGPALEILPDLNLRPSKGKSLKDFVDEKSPKTNQDLYVVIVYYLQKTLKQSEIGLNHIYTCLKELKKIKVPAQLGTTLSTTGKRSGRIDTGSLHNITLTIHGENFVEHDLPKAKKGE